MRPGHFILLQYGLEFRWHFQGLARRTGIGELGAGAVELDRLFHQIGEGFFVDRFALVDLIRSVAFIILLLQLFEKAVRILEQ